MSAASAIWPSARRARWASCRRPGEPARLLIETHVREDHIHLYGFIDAAERDWFRLLTTVQGVGARLALAILSAVAPDALTLAIVAQDKAMLARADGVGPRLAARIVNELQDKVGGLALARADGRRAGAAPPAGAVDGAIADAVSALVNLGYRPRRGVRRGRGGGAPARRRGQGRGADPRRAAGAGQGRDAGHGDERRGGDESSRPSRRRRTLPRPRSAR